MSLLRRIADAVFGPPTGRQTCMVYCQCGHELIGDPHTDISQFTEGVPEVWRYECPRCHDISYFEFALYPLPVLWNIETNKPMEHAHASL